VSRAVDAKGNSIYTTNDTPSCAYSIEIVEANCVAANESLDDADRL